MKKRSVINIKVEKKDDSKDNSNVLPDKVGEIKKILVNQTKILLNNFNRFVKCKSAQNCIYWKNAADSRMKALSTNLIKCFDDEHKLKNLIRSYKNPSIHDKLSQVIEFSRDNAMSDLGISNDVLNNIVKKVYNILLEQVTKFRELSSENEEEEQKIFDEFYQKFGDLVFEKIYKCKNIKFVVDCTKIPEYEYVSDHPSCKFDPRNVCCYINDLKSDIEKRSVDENFKFISDENLKFIPDKNLNFISNNNLENQKLISQNELGKIIKKSSSLKINSFGYLAIFLPIIFVIILVIKKFKK